MSNALLIAPPGIPMYWSVDGPHVTCHAVPCENQCPWPMVIVHTIHITLSISPYAYVIDIGYLHRWTQMLHVYVYIIERSTHTAIHPPIHPSIHLHILNGMSISVFVSVYVFVQMLSLLLQCLVISAYPLSTHMLTHIHRERCCVAALGDRR